MHHEVSFEKVDHFVRLPTRVGNKHCRFLFDSGIGITIISSVTAELVGAAPMGETLTGQRMSGQALTAPLARLPEISIGGFTVRDHLAGVIDIGSTESGDDFHGILGLDFFADAYLTIDPSTQRVTVADSPPEGDIAIAVEVRRDNGCVAIFAPLELPSGRLVNLEVDTGSAALILDEEYLSDCAVTADDPRIDERHGVDETGNAFTRRFITIDGHVRIPNEPRTIQRAPRVMFQPIIYDGLLGTDFLNRFRYTFDVRHGRLLLRPLPALVAETP